MCIDNQGIKNQIRGERKHYSSGDIKQGIDNPDALDAGYAVTCGNNRKYHNKGINDYV